MVWKIIEQRIGETMGFGAEIKTKEEKKIGDILRQIMPEDLLKFGLIPEFIGRASSCILGCPDQEVFNRYFG